MKNFGKKKFKLENGFINLQLIFLSKRSNGASDFGNKFGQPLITGSILTFEHEEFDKTIGFDLKS